jgi:hypothetical protein
MMMAIATGTGQSPIEALAQIRKAFPWPTFFGSILMVSSDRIGCRISDRAIRSQP